METGTGMSHHYNHSKALHKNGDGEKARTEFRKFLAEYFHEPLSEKLGLLGALGPLSRWKRFINFLNRDITSFFHV
jgi:hypothetical protein